MYEEFLGLSKRPFSSVPNPDCFVPVLPAQEALDSLIHCVTQARGIGVITSAAGLGKSQLCKQLAVNLGNHFRTVYLSTSGFHTRRALLQSILYELGISYVGLSEQEARLRIFEAAVATQAQGHFLLIIADEAHLLNNRLFEELRALSDHSPDGVSLIRVVLSGEFELEEKLADPSLSAFNQRVGAQVCLEPLTLEQSAQFLISRLLWAGAEDASTVLTEDALEAICRASDGNPRCLCQLADHCCLMAYAEEQKPISRGIVLAALNDVKELPLTWSELSAAEVGASLDEEQEIDVEMDSPQVELAVDDDSGLDLEFSFEDRNLASHLYDTDEFEIPVLPDEVVDDTHSQIKESPEIEFAVLEVGGDSTEEYQADCSNETDNIPESSNQNFVTETLDNDMESTLNINDSTSECGTEQQVVMVDQMIEKAVVDRYAFLDRMQILPPERHASVSLQESPEQVTLQMPANVADEAELKVSLTCKGEIHLDHLDDECDVEQGLLETVESIRKEIINPLHGANETESAEEDTVDWVEYDVVQPVAEDYAIENNVFEQDVNEPRDVDHLDPTIELNEPGEFSESTVYEEARMAETKLAATLIDHLRKHQIRNTEELECCDNDAPAACESDGATVVLDFEESATTEAEHDEHHGCEGCENLCECHHEAGSMENEEASQDRDHDAETESPVVTEIESVSKPVAEDSCSDKPEKRRFEQLFSRLRLRRRKAQERAAG